MKNFPFLWLDPNAEPAMFRAMRQLLKRVSRFLLIGTLFVSLGGHFALLQTFAWGTMLMSYSKNASFGEAARKTFDGEHPCPMCKLVKQSKEREKEKVLVKAEAKLDVVLPVPVRLKTPWGAPASADVPDYAGRPVSLPGVVLLQPPRLA